MGQARLGYRTIDALVGPFFVVRTNPIVIKMAEIIISNVCLVFINII